jgi:hypothetical protein
MNWLSKLLKRPASRPSAPSNPQAVKTAKPGEDIVQLREALASAADSGERTQLATRLGLALARALQAPLAGDPPAAWVAAICQVPDKALALAWGARLEGDAWLGEVAMRARIAEIRFAAAQRIETTAVLEQVAQGSRDKDKRVNRHCADRLRQRRQTDASTRRALEIGEELRGLLATVPLPQPHLLDLQKELGSLGDAGEPGVVCTALMQQAITRLHQEVEARRDLQARRNAAMALAAECANAAWPWNGQLDGWQARLTTLNQVWDGLPPWLGDQAAARALGASLIGIEARLVALAADDEHFLAGERFLATLEAGEPFATEPLAAWAALARPEHPQAREALEARWQALHISAPPQVVHEPAPLPPPPPKPRPQVDRDALRGLLEQLERAVTEGHLADADAVAKQVKALLGGNSPHGTLESRWHGLQSQLETLRGWARWGTGQAREQLIAAAEELLDGEREVDALARAIADLRQEWKRLNAHGAAGKGQWEGFDAALTQAYQPVAAHRAEQAARLAEVRAAKEALCAGWEAEVAAIVWEQADFKVVEARRVDMLRQWRAAPQASFRDERTLRKGFDALIEGIDQRLAAARTLECERRERLILEAEALGGQADLRQAMAEARALQQRWSQEGMPVRLKRSDEQKLWQRFRAACSAVFERQDALRVEQAAQRQERARSRQKLLDAFAATLGAGVDVDGIRHALAQFRADWDASRTDRREPDDSLETAARDLQQQAQRRLDAQRHEKYRARLELMARKAALVDRVEAAALAAEPLTLVMDAVKQAWNALPPLPGKTEDLLARRCTEAGNVTRAALAAGRETREALLLDLEIALDLPSPEDCAEVRRERQLERLQNRFGAVSEQVSEPEEMLARWHATAALPEAAFDQRIAAIVHQMVARAASANAG